MNIFVLDIEPKLAAQYHCNRHVVKMILETTQILSTSVYYYFKKPINDFCAETGLYRPTHINHPCSIWCRRSKENFLWLHQLGMHLIDEYFFRYDKIHACLPKLNQTKSYIHLFPNDSLTDFALAMPEKYKCGDAVKSYRNYYKHDKIHLLQYKKREHPFWLEDLENGRKTYINCQQSKM